MVPPLPTGVPGRGGNDPIAQAQRVYEVSLQAAGTFAMQTGIGHQCHAMAAFATVAQDGCRAVSIDPKNRLDTDKDPQQGPCLGWLCVRIRAARGPVGLGERDGRRVAVPSEPYED